MLGTLKPRYSLATQKLITRAVVALCPVESNSLASLQSRCTGKTCTPSPRQRSASLWTSILALLTANPTKEDDFNGSPSPAVPSSTKGTLRRRQRSIPTNTTGGTNRGM
ncbi:hypothetical protein E4U11_003674 [Claviceps purpurea]|nr:hypothetical protein E4U11_003674 [Claviceps purpurea]